MQVAGQVQYEVQDSENCLRHCCTATYRRMCLAGYVFPDAIEAKFSKKQSRFTFRLLRTGKAASSAASDLGRDSAAEQDVDGPEHFSDATSSAPSTPTGAAPCTAPMAIGHHEQQQQQQPSEQEAELVDDADAAEDATDQPPAAAAATAAAQEGAADDDDEEDDEQETAGNAGQQQKKGKKRRGAKKKKKKKTTAGDEATTAVAASAAAEPDVPAAVAPEPAAAPAAATEPEEDDEFVDAISSEGADDTAAQQQQEQQERASSRSPTGSSKQQQSRPGSAGPPIVFTSDNYMSHFSEEAVAGSSELSASPDVQVLLPQSLLHGPTVHSCLDKHDVKGEDKGLNLKGCSWTPAGSDVAISFSAFGIFDGHGGKPAATFASKELLPMVMRLADRCGEGSSSGDGCSRQASVPAAAAAGPDADVAGDEAWGVEVTDEDRAVWAAQEALVERLPKALFAGFLEADKACRARHRVSGATATLALVAGWELLVANVGDSAAYLDTGKEVIALSGNHRIDDNAAERARILASGGEISKSTADGVPVGPDRVWPGGLAMSRSIGDPQAPQVIAVPEIRHVTLPTTGGRLVIGSDGVWDHMQPKSMIHQASGGAANLQHRQAVRNASTDAAAKKLAAAALKKKGLRDDISVLVVDLVPSSSDTRPPALMLGPARDAVEPCQIMRPLMEVEAAAAAAAGAGAAGSAASSPGQLQTVASVTSVTAGSTSHWRESAAARRSSALRFLRAAKQREWEVEQAEQARLAELAAKAAAEENGAGLSDTYRELAALRIDVDAVIPEVRQELLLQQQQAEAQQAAAAAAADDGWTTVGGSSGGANGYVSFEQQLRAEAAASGGLQRQPRQQQPLEQEQLGPGMRRSRGSRGSRGRGRGRDSSHGEEQQRSGQAALDSAAAAAAVPTGSGEGTLEGGRGSFRRRGERSSRREGRPPRDAADLPQQHQEQQQGGYDATEASAAAAAGGLGRDGGRGSGRGGRAGGRGFGSRGDGGGRGDAGEQQQRGEGT
ncbi:hypothetical protein COO60DRAFT_1703399 [Scenedesmus sp. NREL 46B-D3]|nr:hypothetical protein COO60DRAFT_1703399 [Scenedesmus sp. NREL 46B-D3]